MWLISFFVEPAQFAWIDYFRITSGFHVVLFAVTAYYIKQLAGRKWAIVFVISPAVLYSLNRNWDIWAIVAMIWAIYLFEKGKLRQSAIVLAVSVATKLFPIVLLFPIFFYFMRQKKVREFIEYSAITMGVWFVINLPFMLINFRGWSYFYEFSYKRGIGSASIFDVTAQAGFGIPTWSILFYALNLIIFGGLGLYFWKSAKIVPLTEGAYLTMFAFILFNKQYSMQYVIWLAALAVGNCVGGLSGAGARVAVQVAALDCDLEPAHCGQMEGFAGSSAYSDRVRGGLFPICFFCRARSVERSIDRLV
jgi:uncharacterized membrane protein